MRAKRKAAIIAAGLALWSVGVPSAVYRCPGPNSVTYTDRYCPDGEVQSASGAWISVQANRGEPLAPSVGVSRRRPSAAPAPSAPAAPQWSAARHVAIAHCQAAHPDNYSIQSGCLRNAERGWKQMHSPTGLPAAVDAKIKSLCEENHPKDFSIQAGCLRNQINGYRRSR